MSQHVGTQQHQSSWAQLRQPLPSSHRGPCGCSGCGRRGWREGARASRRSGAATPACELRRAAGDTKEGMVISRSSLDLLQRSFEVKATAEVMQFPRQAWPQYCDTVNADSLLCREKHNPYKHIWSIPQLINTVLTLYFNMKSTSKHSPAQTSKDFFSAPPASCFCL